jgi:UDP-N-acetylglucosamine pyrophosphorylase
MDFWFSCVKFACMDIMQALLTGSGATFRQRTREDAKASLHEEVRKLIESCPEGERPHFTLEMGGFERLFARYLEETKTTIEWDRIKPPPADVLRAYKDLGKVDTGAGDLLNKLVVLKLNGGLGKRKFCLKIMSSRCLPKYFSSRSNHEFFMIIC